VVGLECLVGTSFAATELLQPGATFELLHAHRPTELLPVCERFRAACAAATVLNLCTAAAQNFAAPAGLRAPTTVQLPDSDHF